MTMVNTMNVTVDESKGYDVMIGNKVYKAGCLTLENARACIAMSKRRGLYIRYWEKREA